VEGTPSFVFANKLKALKVNLKNGMRLNLGMSMCKRKPYWLV
jgi:hypothetical protein